MTAVTNELMFEVLKTIQAQVGNIREDVASIKARLTSLDNRVGIVHTDMALLSDRLDRVENHLARVDTRLNISDA